MKHRNVRLTWFTAVLGLVAPPLIAERNLIPSLETIPDVCSERPNEPDWMENIALRDAYQRVLVQDIYRAQSMERVVETGSCDCASRFPTNLGVSRRHLPRKPCRCGPFRHAASLGHLQPPRK